MSSVGNRSVLFSENQTSSPRVLDSKLSEDGGINELNEAVDVDACRRVDSLEGAVADGRQDGIREQRVGTSVWEIFGVQFGSACLSDGVHLGHWKIDGSFDRIRRAVVLGRSCGGVTGDPRLRCSDERGGALGCEEQDELVEVSDGDVLDVLDLFWSVIVEGRIGNEKGRSGFQQLLDGRRSANVGSDHGVGEASDFGVAIEDTTVDDGGSSDDLLRCGVDGGAHGGVDDGVSVDAALGDLVCHEVFVGVGSPRNVDCLDVLSSEILSEEIGEGRDCEGGLLDGVDARKGSAETEENNDDVGLEVFVLVVGILGEEQVAGQASDVADEVRCNAAEVEKSLSEVAISASDDWLNILHEVHGVVDGNGSADLDSRSVLGEDVEFGNVGDEELDSADLRKNGLRSLSDGENDLFSKRRIPRKILIQISKTFAINPINIICGSFEIGNRTLLFLLL